MPEAFDPYYRWLAIPPDEQPPNHYRLLGVPLFESNPDVIETAADGRMGLLRTFQTGRHAELSQKLLNEVAAARVCLLNPQKKAAYDAQLQAQLGARAQRAVSSAPESPAMDPALAGLLETIDRAAPYGPSGAAGKRPQANRASVLAAGAIGALIALGVIVWLTRPAAELSPATIRGRAEQTAAAAAPKPAQGLKAVKPIEPPSSHFASPSPEVTKRRPKPDRLRTTEPTEARRETLADLVQQPEDVSVAPEDGTAIQEPRRTAATAPRKRLPIPSPATQQQITKQVEEIYKPSAAKTRSQKLKLAEELLALGAKPDMTPEERFVLLRTAMDLANDGGNAALAVNAVDAIGAEFEVDGLAVKKKVLARFAEGPSDAARIKSFLEAVGGAIDEALAQDRYELAEDLATMASRVCMKPAGREYRKQVHSRRQEVQALAERWKQIEEAQATLKKDPEDPQANMALGSWLCFDKDDWAAGLPLLAKGSDEALKKLAVQELSSLPANAEAELKLADAWWALAETRKGPVRDALLRHAGSWYQRARPALTSGLTCARVDKRLKEAAELGPPTGQAPSVEAASAQGTRPRSRTAALLRTLVGHTDGVRSVAFARDGALLASASLDKTVRLWDPRTGELRRTIEADAQEVRGAALSADGVILATAGGEPVVKLWNPESGTWLGTLTGHAAPVTCVAFSPRGKLLASGGDRTVIVWDAARRALRHRLQAHTETVTGLAFSPDGATVASGSTDATLLLWDVASGQLRKGIACESGPVEGLAFSPDGSVVATAHGAGVKLWDPASGELRGKIAEGEQAVTLAFSLDSAILAVGCADGRIKLWDRNAGTLVQTLEGHAAAVGALAFAPAGNLLASGSADRTVKLWQLGNE